MQEIALQSHLKSLIKFCSFQWKFNSKDHFSTKSFIDDNHGPPSNLVHGHSKPEQMIVLNEHACFVWNQAVIWYRIKCDVQ